MQIPVQDLMNRRIPSVLEDASINDAAIALLEHDAAEVYVVTRGGVLRGVIPEYAILKARLCGIRRDEAAASLISRSPRTVHPTASVVAVAGLFREAFRSALAVVDDQGRLIGQIKRREVLWLLTTLDRLDDPADTEADGASESIADPAESVRQPNYMRRRRILGEQLANRSAAESDRT